MGIIETYIYHICCKNYFEHIEKSSSIQGKAQHFKIPFYISLVENFIHFSFIHSFYLPVSSMYSETDYSYSTIYWKEKNSLQFQKVPSPGMEHTQSYLPSFVLTKVLNALVFHIGSCD